MARFTVRLDDADEDDPGAWVEREAERRGRSKAWVIEQAVQAARGAESAYSVSAGDEPVVDEQAVDAAVERLLAAVEHRCASNRSEGGSEDVDLGGDDTASSSDVEEVTVSSGDDGSDAMEDPVERLRLPGDGDELDARRETLRDLYDTIRAANGESVATQELKQLVDADAVGYASVDSFWTNVIKANARRPNALTELPGVEHIRAGRYRYIEE